MALISEKQRVYAYPIIETTKLAVKGSSKIYAGSYVGLTSGYSRAFNDGDLFAGIALDTVDNSGGSDGDVYVNVVLKNTIKHVSVTNTADVTDQGNAVYVIGDDSLTEVSTGNTSFGKVGPVRSSSDIDVSFKSVLLA